MGFFARVILLAALAAVVNACSRPNDEPMTYDKVVKVVQSIAYEPDHLADLLGRRVALDLRRFGTTTGYYVDQVHLISFGCRTEDGDFDGHFTGGLHVVARVVDFDALPSGVTTITLDRCSSTRSLPFDRYAISSATAAITPAAPPRSLAKSPRWPSFGRDGASPPEPTSRTCA